MSIDIWVKNEEDEAMNMANENFRMLAEMLHLETDEYLAGKIRRENLLNVQMMIENSIKNPAVRKPFVTEKTVDIVNGIRFEGGTDDQYWLNRLNELLELVNRAIEVKKEIFYG